MSSKSGPKDPYKEKDPKRQRNNPLPATAATIKATETTVTKTTVYDVIATTGTNDRDDAELWEDPLSELMDTEAPALPTPTRTPSISETNVPIFRILRRLSKYSV